MIINEVHERAILNILNPILPHLSRASHISEDDLAHQFIFCFNDVKINSPDSGDVVQMIYEAAQSFVKWLRVDKKVDNQLVHEVFMDIRAGLKMSEREDAQDGLEKEPARIIPFPKK